MNDFVENLKKSWQEFVKKFRVTWAKITGKPVPKETGAVVSTISKTYEINLVPEVKAQMIKAQKMRNIVLFICIVVSSVAIGAVVILFGIKSGQDIAMSNQDKRMSTMSKKMGDYTELNDLVTIQEQLNGIAELVDQKTVLSRVFGALGVMLPQGEDDVKLSELRVNLETSEIMMDGQADAQVAPLIDYRVLESFKKGVALTKYDYGRYVDIDGKEIPTHCINEGDADGNAYKTGDSYYAWWDLTVDGCKAAPKSLQENAEMEFHYSADAEVEKDEVEVPVEELVAAGNVTVAPDGAVTIRDSVVEARTREDGSQYYVRVDVKRVKVWRTPQFTEWFRAGHMQLDGNIDGIQHFVSACYKYSGTQVSGDQNVKWTSTNDCMLAPDGLTIASSANGRDESDNLVLKFTGLVKLEEAFFSFQNKHMIAIGPMGQNVTDSYIQIGGMFAQEARECEEGDSECILNSVNKGGN